MDVLVGVGLGSNQDTNWIGLIGMDAACPESYPVRAHRAVIKLHPLEVALEDLNQACQSDCEHQSVTAQSQHSDRTVTAQSQHSYRGRIRGMPIGFASTNQHPVSMVGIAWI